MAERPELPERLEGAIRVPDEEALRRLFREPLDFGCRPSAAPDPAGGYSVTVIGPPEALERLEREGFDVRIVEPPKERGWEVGEGDRVEGGRVVPRGFGRQIVEEGEEE
jgi:hypothetical protein